MSEPPARSHYTGDEDINRRLSTQRRSDPPVTAVPTVAVPVVKAAEPPALVARVVARQQDPNLGLPTYKSQINGRSILRVESNNSEAQLTVSDDTARSIEEARRQQQADQNRPTRPSPPAPLATKAIVSTSSHQEPAPTRAKAKEPTAAKAVATKAVATKAVAKEPAATKAKAKEPASINEPATKKHAAAPPTASPKPMKPASATNVSSPSTSPNSTKQGSVKKVTPPPPPVNPVHEPAPVSPVPKKAPPVNSPFTETWEFAAPDQERGSCCVII